MPRKKSTSTTKRRQQLSFEDWYEIAKKYYEEHGDLLVPRIYEDEEGHKLGRWIERLRAVYNGNPKIKVVLTQTGIMMLEKIGMVWKLENRYPWPEWYLQCRLYYAANGDLLVPKMYKNEQYALGNWIGEQRKKYKKGTLKPEQVEALEKVGMVWELVDRDVWEKRYNDAYAYYNEHGNIDVSPNFLTAGNMYLRDWLIAQKSLYQEANCEIDLDWERHDLLDDIGMDWEKQVGRKSYSYAYRAQRYYNEFGNLDVPEDYNDMMGGNLHEWVKRQWRLYHRPTTDKSDAYISKKKELENIGFDWSCEGRWDWDAKEATWLQNYNGINGLNINNNAGSTHIEGLQKFVVEKGLDVGFAYDGDADRCLCVDEKGNVITGDHILYIYGCYMKERGKLLTNTVVTTVMSNFGLYKAFDERGIGYAKTAVGDKYVYEYMAKNGCRIGGEQSGHIIFSKYASTGDGILTSLKMMEVMLAKKLHMSKLAEPLKIYPQVLENVRVTDKKAAQDDEAVQAAVKTVAEALGDAGRILVRESGTEPVVRVMVEAPDHDTCQKYVSQVVETIKSRGYRV